MYRNKNKAKPENPESMLQIYASHNNYLFSVNFICPKFFLKINSKTLIFIGYYQLLL